MQVIGQYIYQYKRQRTGSGALLLFESCTTYKNGCGFSRVGSVTGSDKRLNNLRNWLVLDIGLKTGAKQNGTSNDVP